MLISKYSFPNPNNGERYDLSQKELVELLDKAYKNGWDQAREVYDKSLYKVTTTASMYENMDDNTRWKEIWIK